MIKVNIQEAVNKQINNELFSAYLYQSMSSYFSSINLPGIAQWFNIQVQEEMFHAKKFYDYLIERGGKIKLYAIDEPQAEWSNPLSAFEAAYEHECKITNDINCLVDLAISEKDHATNNFLQWFVSEQVEEEANVDEVVQKLKLIGDNRGGGLFMIDKELGTRVFNPPTE